VKLITQPENGIEPLLRAVKSARQCIDIAIFRCDIKALERELAAAVARGVVVRALIAHTNRGGDKGLRALELRLLASGVTVTRTDDDLVRYHGKLLLIDRSTLYVLGFNFTANDVKSRSFGVRTKNPKVLRDVLALLEADRTRCECRPAAPDLVVSPQNARRRLTRFLRKARVSLDIYARLSDAFASSLIAGIILRGRSPAVTGPRPDVSQGAARASRPDRRTVWPGCRRFESGCSTRPPYGGRTAARW
jgi:hypothetical protein